MRRPASRSLAEQAFVLRSRFHGSVIDVSATRMTWTAKLRPTPLSREYTVRIAYQSAQFPRVKVLPRLPCRAGEPLPHFYREGLLCLHKVDEWSPDMLIADTIVPWTCEWLIHYELWLATGEWHAGGETPVEDAQTNPSSSSDGGSRRARRARRTGSGGLRPLRLRSREAGPPTARA